MLLELKWSSYLLTFQPIFRSQFYYRILASDECYTRGQRCRRYSINTTTDAVINANFSESVMENLGGIKQVWIADLSLRLSLRYLTKSFTIYVPRFYIWIYLCLKFVVMCVKEKIRIVYLCRYAKKIFSVVLIMLIGTEFQLKTFYYVVYRSLALYLLYLIMFRHRQLLYLTVVIM